MKVCFDEIGYMAATFPASTNAKVGQVCMLLSNGTVAPVGENMPFMGVIRQLRDGYATVQLEGFAQAGYSGEAPTLGYCQLASDGVGGTVTNYDGKEYLCVHVDTDAQTVTFKL